MLYTVHCNLETVKRLFQIIILIISIILFTGCAPSNYSARPKQVKARPLPSTQIYFYPLQNQTQLQQERDRYECYLWAVGQSGFDPNQSNLAPHQRVEVKPSPPLGTGVVIGAASGAAIGSIVTSRRRTGEGLVFGTIAGALVGLATDMARQNEAERIQQQHDANNDRHYALLEKQARDYRRAMSACLEGREYSVQ